MTNGKDYDEKNGNDDDDDDVTHLTKILGGSGPHGGHPSLHLAPGCCAQNQVPERCYHLSN